MRITGRWVAWVLNAGFGFDTYAWNVQFQPKAVSRTNAADDRPWPH